MDYDKEIEKYEQEVERYKVAYMQRAGILQYLKQEKEKNKKNEKKDK